MNGTAYERLKNARKFLNLSQEFVAKQLDIPRTAITAIEAGERNISSEELLIFSELYGLSFDQIMYGEDAQADVKVFARLYTELSEIDKLEIQNLIEFKKNIRKHIGEIR